MEIRPSYNRQIQTDRFGNFRPRTVRIGPVVENAYSVADPQHLQRDLQMRIVLWGALMLVNVVLYYEAPMTQNPTYCVLVLFIAGVCCWPVQQRKNLTR